MQGASQGAQKPWLVLTLRRTGGTSLTEFLSRVSAYPTAEHELFNRKRSMGAVTTGFLATKDSAALERAMADALRLTPNIKHCVEVVPLEVTRALIDAAAERGYHMMVLTRRDEARRLISLFLALATDVWGPDAAAERYPRIIEGSLVPPPIKIEKIRERARMDQRRIDGTRATLRKRGIAHDELTFEDLYMGDIPLAEQARALARKLGAEIAPDHPELAALASGGGQRTDSIAAYVKNYDEAVAIIREVTNR